MARWTVKQRKNIIADYALTHNLSATGRKWGISAAAVKRIIVADPKASELFKQKDKEVTADILKYMDGLSPKICELLNIYVTELTNPTRLSLATVKDLAIAMGIVIDKFTANAVKPPDAAQQDALNKLDEMLKGLSAESKKDNPDDTLK